MIIVFAAIIFASLFNDGICAQKPYCNQVHMFKNLDRYWSDYAVIFNYSMDVSISAVDEWNTMLSFSNYTSWSADPNLYYQDKPLRYITNGETENPYINCPTMNGPCNINVFNGANGMLQVPIHIDGKQDYSYATSPYTDFRFDMGTLYQTDFGNFFDPNGITCFTSYRQSTSGTILERYCCTNYFYVTIPDSPPPQCTNFESNTTFSTSDGNVIASFTATYAYLSSGIEYSINPTLLSSNYPLYQFYPNSLEFTWKNNTLPMTFIDTDHPHKNLDGQVDVCLAIKDDVYDAKYGGMTIAGRILRRNGILLKDQMNPYTPNDPCISSVAPLYSGTQANNNFCCTKFRIPSIADTCAEYQSFTKVYIYEVYQQIYFNVKYQFNDTNMILTIQSYGNPKTSTLSVEAYSTDLFSQTCMVSTDSPTNTCVFKLSATNQYTLQYRTSINRDSVNMTSIYVSGNQIFDPYLTPAKPCQAFFNFDMSDPDQRDRAMTEFCCIDKSGGDWPGALSSSGYPYPYGHSYNKLHLHHDTTMPHLNDVIKKAQISL